MPEPACEQVLLPQLLKNVWLMDVLCRMWEKWDLEACVRQFPAQAPQGSADRGLLRLHLRGARVTMRPNCSCSWQSTFYMVPQLPLCSGAGRVLQIIIIKIL